MHYTSLTHAHFGGAHLVPKGGLKQPPRPASLPTEVQLPWPTRWECGGVKMVDTPVHTIFASSRRHFWAGGNAPRRPSYSTAARGRS